MKLDQSSCRMFATKNGSDVLDLHRSRWTSFPPKIDSESVKKWHVIWSEFRKVSANGLGCWFGIWSWYSQMICFIPFISWNPRIPKQRAPNQQFTTIRGWTPGWWSWDPFWKDQTRQKSMVNLRDLPIAHVCWVGKKNHPWVGAGNSTTGQNVWLYTLFSHNHGSVESYPKWKELYIYLILEIHQFSTEPWLWEEV